MALPTAYDILERAAIMHFDGGLSVEHADLLAGVATITAPLLTKPEYDLLKIIRENGSIKFEEQKKEEKLAIHRMIKKDVLICDSSGLVTEIKH